MHFFRLIISAKVYVHSKENQIRHILLLNAFCIQAKESPFISEHLYPVKTALCAASSDKLSSEQQQERLHEELQKLWFWRQEV